MKGIILAGGLGTRLRPITYEIPKPLITVKKRPIINYIIDLFRKHGVSDVGVIVSREHASDFIHWQKDWQNELAATSLFYEEKPAGTFGWLKNLRDWIGGEKFILSNGDELKDFDLTALKNFHETHNPVATIALVKVPNPHEYGVPILNGHLVQDFLEKPSHPPSEFVNSGLYILEPSIFNYADLNQDYLMIEKDVFPKVAASGKLAGMKMENSRWYDCGNLERWEKAINEW
ncbi:MAG: nucleotidyltransferase family protein [Candidatus Liptonbacteria bacterium]|nr:nucleotidyltransferase family protein [Candidatus Liptonbacteria bacterium]